MDVREKARREQREGKGNGWESCGEGGGKDAACVGRWFSFSYDLSTREGRNAVGGWS